MQSLLICTASPQLVRSETPSTPSIHPPTTAAVVVQVLVPRVVKKNTTKKKTTAGKKKKRNISQPPASNKKHKGRAEFLIKLYELLNAANYSTIVSWYENAFVIWDRLKFTDIIIPMLYRHKKFASFERQMNYYSFTKMAVDAEAPSAKRLKKTDASKWKHREFNQHASLTQVSKITRTTSPHYSSQEMVKTLLLAKERNTQIKIEISVKQKVIDRLRARLATLPPLESTVVPAVSESKATTHVSSHFPLSSSSSSLPSNTIIVKKNILKRKKVKIPKKTKKKVKTIQEAKVKYGPVFATSVATHSMTIPIPEFEESYDNLDMFEFGMPELQDIQMGLRLTDYPFVTPLDLLHFQDIISSV